MGRETGPDGEGLSRRRLVTDTASLACGQIALLAAGAITNILSARWLGPSGKGQLVVTFAVVTLLAPVAAGGVDTYIAANAGGGRTDNHALLRLGYRAAWLGGLTLALSTVAYGIGSSLPMTLVGIAAAAALLRPMHSVLQAIATSRDRTSRVGGSLVVAAVVQVGIVIALAPTNLTPTGFAVAYAAGIAVGCYLLIAVSRRATAPVPLDDKAFDRRAVLRFGRKVVVADALQLANYRIDLFFLAAFATPAAVGVYAVAVTLVEVLWQIPNAASRSVFPRVRSGELHLSGVRRIARRLVSGLSLGGVAVLMFTLAATEPVFGRGYSDVPTLLAILLPGVVLVGAAKPLAAWALSQGRPQTNLRGSAAGFAVALVGNAILIPRYHAVGAALASTAAYATTAVLVAVGALRLGEGNPGESMPRIFHPVLRRLYAWRVYGNPARYWDSRHARNASGLEGVGCNALDEDKNAADYETKWEHIREVFEGRTAGWTVLDAGCGNGFLTERVYGLGVAVEGVDFSAVAADQARTRLGTDVPVHVSPLHRFAPERRYSTVMCIDVLFHVVDDDTWAATVRNLASLAEHELVIQDHLVEDAPSQNTTAVHCRWRTLDMYRRALPDWQLASHEVYELPHEQVTKNLIRFSRSAVAN